MAKQQKSAAELAGMIRDQLGQPELRVAVYGDAGGWHAKVYAAPSAAIDHTVQVNRVSEQLRALYDLEN